eukprot:6226-Pyramimonas_sp.AAC.1
MVEAADQDSLHPSPASATIATVDVDSGCGGEMRSCEIRGEIRVMTIIVADAGDVGDGCIVGPVLG